MEDYIDVFVKRLIRLSDILILVHIFKCLYQLFELGGEQLYNAILKFQSSRSLMTRLIDFLTIETFLLKQ